LAIHSTKRSAIAWKKPKTVSVKLSAAYNRVYFPIVDELDSREFLAPVTIDNGLKLGKGGQSAEAQIEAPLASSRANY